MTTPNGKTIYGDWREKKKPHHHNCTDPFCSGCMWVGAANSSECITTNVEIIRKKYHGAFEGITKNGKKVWIHPKYEKEFRKILPPGINICSKIFGMTIMKNLHSSITCPAVPWKCIKIYEKPYERGMTILHPKGCYPFSLGTMVQIPIEMIGREWNYY